MVNNNFFGDYTFVFDQKLFTIFFLLMISLHKLHSHIHCEEFYEYMKFQKISINTLIKISYPNFRNKQNPGIGQLGVTYLKKNIEKNSIENNSQK